MASRPVVIQKSDAIQYDDTPLRVVSGADAVRAAKELAFLQRNRDLWPYPWSFPPPDGERVHVEGIIAAPVAATQTIVASYTVDNGFNFVLTGIVQIFTVGFILGSTDITWVLDINQPLGANVVQGYPVQGFGSSNIPKGGLGIGGSGPIVPYPLSKPEILAPLDTLRSKVTTTANITPGTPNFFITMFEGWKVPSGK